MMEATTELISGMSTAPPGASPEKMYCEPFGCESPIPGVGCVMQRTTLSLSATFAVRLSSSVNCIPGTTVEIVLNGLRCSVVASGFGSKVSMCDTPPCSKITKTCFACPFRPELVAARADGKLPKPATCARPPSPRPMKLRRRRRGM